MNFDTQQPEEEVASPPRETAVVEESLAATSLSEESEDDFDHSVFPHFWVCFPIALLMCWQFYDLFEDRVFFYRVGASGAYSGQTDIIGPAWILIPLLFAALLFFGFWNARFAREGGATKAGSLRRAFLAMAGVFVLAALITWLLILNKDWTWPV